MCLFFVQLRGGVAFLLDPVCTCHRICFPVDNYLHQKKELKKEKKKKKKEVGNSID